MDVPICLDKGDWDSLCVLRYGIIPMLGGGVFEHGLPLIGRVLEWRGAKKLGVGQVLSIYSEIWGRLSTWIELLRLDP